MKRRCYVEKCKSYARYGKRGILVGEEWHVFDIFYSDMVEGWFPGSSIDRKDNLKGYCLDNCRWATRSQQQVNRAGMSPSGTRGKLLSVPITKEAHSLAKEHCMNGKERIVLTDFVSELIIKELRTN